MQNAAAEDTVVRTIVVPELAAGEILAGLILENGTPKHWVVLLPGELGDSKWKAALEWAREQGGELPTRKEQSLLFANCGEHFQPDWYWSNTQRAGDEVFAWFQDFTYGDQSWGHVCNTCRARAVRRVPIQ